jgi:hypothetical protein
VGIKRLVASRRATAVVLALLLLGCAPSGEPVRLLTGVDPDACYAGGETGMRATLLADPDYGTSFNGRPVMWPVGFTAVRVGGEVLVLGGGRVVATTGRDYYISIAPVYAPESQHLMERVDAFPAAAKCPYPWDFVDCGSPSSPSSDSQYCRPPAAALPVSVPYVGGPPLLPCRVTVPGVKPSAIDC